MELKDNPFLKPENYFAGYQESIEGLKNHPELIEFDKLCYELFEMNEQGKKFMQIVIDKYMLNNLVNRDAANYAITTIWADGFRDFIRMIRNCITSQSQRIKAEVNKK